ncbi:MAG: stage V sporulation protein G [Planctomycetota bacterium]|jgi:stage V sporulation protein G
MNLTEIRVKLLPRPMDKLLGFASITIDDTLVVRDIKIIEGPNGLFVAMPSRKLCDRCLRCSHKNSLRSRYCGDCGARLADGRGQTSGRKRFYADIAHPIHQRAREFVQGAVLGAYSVELERSKQDGYRAVEFDDLDYDYLSVGEEPRP